MNFSARSIFAFCSANLRAMSILTLVMLTPCTVFAATLGDKIRNLNERHVTPCEIRFYWSPPSDWTPVEYKYRWSPTGQVFTTTGREVSKPAKEGEKVTIEVWGVKAHHGGETPKSSAQGRGLPYSPMVGDFELAVASVGDTSIKLAIRNTPSTNSNRAPSSFEIKRKGGNTVTVNPNQSSQAQTFGNLTPGTSYRFVFKVRNCAGEVTYPYLNVSTGERPGIPTNLLLEGPGATYLTARWSAPRDKGAAERYEIMASKTAIKGGVKSQSSGTFATVKNLEPNTEYAVKVRALNGFGAGAWTSTKTMTTASGLPGAPGNLSFSNIKGNSADFSWAPPGSVKESLQYEVEYMNKLKRIWVKHGKVSTTRVTVGSLEPQTTYVFRVRAVSQSGAGDWAVGRQEVVTLGK